MYYNVSTVAYLYEPYSCSDLSDGFLGKLSGLCSTLLGHANEIGLLTAKTLELSPWALDEFLHGVCDVRLQLTVALVSIAGGDGLDFLSCACREDSEEVGCAGAIDRVICDPKGRVGHCAFDFGAHLRWTIGQEDA